MLGGSVAGPGGVALSTAKYARPGESPCPVELETNLCEDFTRPLLVVRVYKGSGDRPGTLIRGQVID